MSNAIKEQYFKRMSLMEQTEAEMNRVYDQLTPESDAEETAMVIDVVAKLADNNIMHGIHFDVLNAQVLGTPDYQIKESQNQKMGIIREELKHKQGEYDKLPRSLPRDVADMVYDDDMRNNIALLERKLNTYELVNHKYNLPNLSPSEIQEKLTELDRLTDGLTNEQDTYNGYLSAQEDGEDVTELVDAYAESVELYHQDINQIKSELGIREPINLNGDVNSDDFTAGLDSLQPSSLQQ